MVFTLGLRHTFRVWPRGLALVQFPLFKHRSLRLGRCRKNLPLHDAGDHRFMAETKLTRDDAYEEMASTYQCLQIDALNNALKENGSSVGAFNSVAIANPEVVLGLNFYAKTQKLNPSDFLVLDDILVSASSAPDAGNPPSDSLLREILDQYNALYSSRSRTECRTAKRLVIDSYPSALLNADTVATAVSAQLHRLMGGELVTTPNFRFSELYPNGIGGEQSEFSDDGRRIAELIFDVPIPEHDVLKALGAKPREKNPRRRRNAHRRLKLRDRMHVSPPGGTSTLAQCPTTWFLR